MKKSKATEVITFYGEVHAPGNKIMQNKNILVMDIPGSPEIPYLRINLLLPPCNIVSNIFLIPGKRQILKNIYIESSPLPEIAEENKAKRIPDKKVYENNKFFPHNDFENIGTFTKNGRGIIVLNIYPYKFNPVTKELSWFENYSIKIHTHYNSEFEKRETKRFAKSKTINERIAFLVSNPEADKKYTEE